MTGKSGGWKIAAATIAAILLGLMFTVSGGWKVLEPFKLGQMLEQAQVPAGMGVPGAVALGVVELFAAFLLFVPRFRRWGGLLSTGLIAFFISWIGYFYQTLVGQECNCFPIIKRTVGPAFFVADGIMLLLALIVLFWSRPPRGFKIPSAAFAALVVFAGISFGVNASQRNNAQVPTPVIVDGKPQNLAQGKVFLFFYNPECMECVHAAKFMSHLNWDNTEIVGIPTNDPEFAADFLKDTKLKAETSLKLKTLKKAFPFVDPPYGVALENGRVKGQFSVDQFNPPLAGAALKKIGLVK
ncbi:MAG: MauE/DoxX family redox-associated membrane protein [Bryobacteraceae bacterium]